MDWKSFISSVVSSLAWPAVVTLFIFLVRRQLVPLVERLEEIALPGGTKAKFSKALIEIREKIAELPVSSAQALPAPSPSQDELFLELASKYPSAAILEAYKPIENAISNYKIKYPSSKYSSQKAFFDSLVRVQGVGSEIAWLFDHVRNLRNRAVHTADFSLTPGAALEYRDVCLRVASEIESAIQLIEEKSLIARTGYAGNRDPD